MFKDYLRETKMVKRTKQWNKNIGKAVKKAKAPLAEIKLYRTRFIIKSPSITENEVIFLLKRIINETEVEEVEAN